MRITTFDLGKVPEEERSGLGPVRMAKLGEVVVLAGPNGSGKTRLLYQVRQLLSAESAWRTARRDDGSWSEGRRALHREALLELNEAGVVTTGDWRTAPPVHFIFPRGTELKDPRDESVADGRDAAASVGSKLDRDVLDYAVVYINHVQTQHREATHPDYSDAEGAKAQAITSYAELQRLLRSLLGVELGRDRNGDATLFGRAICAANLSDGQRLLVKLVVSLHAQGAQLGGLVLLIDEPELHLHPAALIDVLERLRTANPGGQLWIATHALHVLAWAPDSLWFVQDGNARWVGREPERVLDALLGHQVGRDRMSDFLALPAQLASVRFASECLVPPEVVSTGPSDDQLQQIRRAISAIPRSDRPLRVLDYGAGKGRLLGALAELGLGDLDYRAFDPSPDHHEERRLAVVAAYGDTSDTATRLLDREEELRTHLNPGSVDAVVLCNVLHEIDPAAWVRTFGPGSALATTLRPDGYLLVVEDQHIPVGERAHRHGFLLLEGVQLRMLFREREGMPRILTQSVRDGRLQLHLVPASHLKNVNHPSVIEALTGLMRSAKEKVRGLREAPAGSAEGRMHGMWTQLLANAVLALEDLGGGAGVS